MLIGLVSAVLLYAIFALGNTLSGWLFRFAPHQVSAIYDIRHEGSPLAMALVLLFITSPAEEVFWRGFVQRWFTHRFGGKAGWLLAVCVYAGVHIFSGNLMLVMAALTAGLFWGWLYWKTDSLVPCILSHAFWTVAVFILWPLTPGV